MERDTSPNVGSGRSALKGVAVVGPADVWAVGVADKQTLAMHWNGSTWMVANTPSASSGPSALRSVFVVSPTDVWAAGRGGRSILVERWRGSSWRIRRVPVPRHRRSFNALTGTDASDVWAVGRVNREYRVIRPLAMHWDGSSWTKTRVPLLPSPWGQNASEMPLYDVAMTGGRPRVVGGYTPDPGSAGSVPVSERWNGSAWKVEPMPPLSLTFDARLYGLSASSSRDAWAVGTADRATLAMHWNGDAWGRIPSPNATEPVEPGWNQLRAVAVQSPTAVWAVGYYEDTSGDHTLIERGTAT